MHKNRFYKKTVVKWIISLVLFTSLTVITISISLYNWYALDNIRLYSKMAESTLDNASKKIETLDESLKSVGFLAVNDNDFTDMMCSSSIDSWLNGVLKRKIMNMIFTNPIISSSYLVNKKADWVVGSPSYDWVQAGPYSDSINKLVQDQNKDAIIRINTYKAQISEVNYKASIDNIFSYVFFLTRQSNTDDSFLIFNVKQSDMEKSLDNFNSLAESNVIVTDRSGKVVLSKDQGQLYKDFGDKGFMRKILESKDSTGYFNYMENAKQFLITYVRSDKLDFYFISITPYETVRKTSIALRDRTVALSIIILLIGLVVAIFISMYFYSPLKKLLKKYVPSSNSGNERSTIEYKNEYEMLDKLIEQNYNKAVSLDGFLNSNLPIIKQDYLKKILEGKININNEFSKERLSDIGVDLSFDNYQVICLALVDADDLKNTSSEMLAVRQNICKIAGDFLKLICNCETVWEMNDETAAVLLNYDDSIPEINERILRACSSIQEYSHVNLGIKLTIAIGKAEMNDVYGSFLNAVELLRYKLKYDDGSIIYQEKVENDISGYDLFPENEEKSLLRSLRSLSIESSSECIRQIVRQFHSYNVSDILRAVDHILYSTFQVVREMIKNRDVSSEIDFFYTYEKLIKYKSLQEMEENLISFYGSIIRDIGRTLNGSDDSHNELIRRVMDYIKKNYLNPAISLEYVAEYINLNPSYLGKIFKEGTGIHFTEYVNKLRLDTAKELLASTNESINHISTLVGFNSTTYFVTCFKKYTGLTPAKFR